MRHSPEVRQKVIDTHKKEEISVAALAQRFGMTYNTVLVLLKRHEKEEPLIKKGGQQKRYSLEFKKEIIAAYLVDTTIPTIKLAQRFDVSTDMVRRMIKLYEAGEPLERKHKKPNPKVKLPARSDKETQENQKRLEAAFRGDLNHNEYVYGE